LEQKSVKKWEECVGKVHAKRVNKLGREGGVEIHEWKGGGPK